MLNPSNQERLRLSAWKHILAVGVLGVSLWLAHCGALDDGLFLDDRWHQKSLQEAEWNFSDLLESSTLDTGRFIQTWWQVKPLRWDYSRPVAMAWMKWIQSLSGGRVWVQHLSNIFWHYVCVLLLYSLACQLIRKWGWSLLCGFAFLIYPHTVYAVGWLAAQNVVIQTALTLAALVLYAQASRLNLYLPCFSANGLKRACPAIPQDYLSETNVAPLRWFSFSGVLVFYLLALLTRENAVVFPVLAAGFDWALGAWSHLKRRWSAHLILVLVTVGFLWWRMAEFPGHIPDVYFRRWDDWSYPLWCGWKLLHYLSATVWLTPMMIGPRVWENPLRDTPGDFVLMVVVLLVLLLGYWRACRGWVRGYWLWPMWILLAVLPVVPVFATPHSGYMAGVGFVLALMVKPACAPPRDARGSIAVVCWFVAASITAFSIYRVCWRGVVRAEQYAIAQMQTHSAPPADSDIFLINLPLANIYLPLDLQKSWAIPADRQRYHALTFAPHVLSGPSNCRIEQKDDYSFEVSLIGQRFFSGLLGRFLLEGMGRRQPFTSGEVIHAPRFDVQILRADDAGVHEILFRFHQALASDTLQFYLFQQDDPGIPLKFRPAGANQDYAAYPVFEKAALESGAQFREAREGLFRVLDTTSRIIRTDLYMTGRAWRP